MLLDVVLVGEVIVVQVETVSQQPQPKEADIIAEDPTIEILTTPRLMDSDDKNDNPQRKISTAESGAEPGPGVEFHKGVGSSSSPFAQHLPTVHNTVAAAPLFNSYRSMFQGWKNSVPKLYKYPSSEIEVVIYRKNGEIVKLKKTAEGGARNESDASIESVTSDTTFYDQPKDLSQLMADASNLQLITARSSASSRGASPSKQQKPDVDSAAPSTSLTSTLSPHVTPYDQHTTVIPTASEYYESSKLSLIQPTAESAFRLEHFNDRQEMFTSLNQLSAVEMFRENVMKESNYTLPAIGLASTETFPCEVESSSPGLANESTSETPHHEDQHIYGSRLSPLPYDEEIKGTTHDKYVGTIPSLTEEKSIQVSNNNESEIPELIIKGTVADICTQANLSAKVTAEAAIQHAPLISVTYSQTEKSRIQAVADSCIQINLPVAATEDAAIQHVPLLNKAFCQTEKSGMQTLVDKCTQGDLPIAITEDAAIQHVPLLNKVFCQTEKSGMQALVDKCTQSNLPIAKITEDAAVQNVAPISIACSQTEKSGVQTFADSFTQSSLAVTITEDAAVQHVPLVSKALCQTENPETVTVACQAIHQQTLDTKSAQTDPVPDKIGVEFGCQVVPAVTIQANQTEPTNVNDADCQTQMSSNFKGTQTERVGINAACQTAALAPPISIQTTTENLIPMSHTACQTMLLTVSKSSQVTQDLKEVASQCSSSQESKETQLSGSCCYFREKRIRKEYEKMAQIQKQNDGGTSDGSYGAASLPAELSRDSKEQETGNESSVSLESSLNTYTEEDVQNLIAKFKSRARRNQEYQNELRWQVSQLTQQVVSSRSLEMDTSNEQDYFEDDIMRTSESGA